MSLILTWLKLSILMTALVLAVIFFCMSQQQGLHAPNWDELWLALPLLLKISPIGLVGFFLGQWFIHATNDNDTE